MCLSFTAFCVRQQVRVTCGSLRRQVHEPHLHGQVRGHDGHSRDGGLSGVRWNQKDPEENSCDTDERIQPEYKTIM